MDFLDVDGFDADCFDVDFFDTDFFVVDGFDADCFAAAPDFVALGLVLRGGMRAPEAGRGGRLAESTRVSFQP